MEDAIFQGIELSSFVSYEIVRASKDLFYSA
jgi:hypothetical protein